MLANDSLFSQKECPDLQNYLNSTPSSSTPSSSTPSRKFARSLDSFKGDMYDHEKNAKLTDVYKNGGYNLIST